LTALHVASMYGHLESMAVLLQHGADINRNTASGETALYLATKHRRHQAIQLLIDHNASVTAHTTTCSLMYLACERNAPQVVSALVQSKCDVNGMDKSTDLSPLHIAASNGHYETVHHLLQLKAHVYGRNAALETPLHLAARQGHLGVATALLERGALVNATNGQGYSPLHFAAIRGFKHLALMLIEHKADVHLTTNKRSTALDLASGNDHNDMVLLLLACRANASGTRSTAASLSASNKSLIDTLLDFDGIDGNPTRGSWYSRLHLAADSKHPFALQSLLQLRADVNSKKSIRARTPLHLAAGNASFKASTLLLQHNADVNAVDSSLETPLHMAVASRETSIVLLLLRHRADINSRCKRGNTALHLAVIQQSFDMARLLLEHGADRHITNVCHVNSLQYCKHPVPCCTQWLMVIID
jgi:ankyrin repeat protein